MDVPRKIAGGFLLVFFALPALTAAIWSTGMTRAVFSDEFLSGIPNEVIAMLPELVDDLYRVAQEPGNITDPEAQKWLEAFREADFSPSDFVKGIGIYGWLEKDVASMLTQFSQVLRGELDPKVVVLDNRPLKAALLHPQAQDTIRNVLAQLPGCSAPEQQEWARAQVIRQDRHRDSPFPPCNPGGQVTEQAVSLVLTATVDIPDEIRPFKDKDLPSGFNVVRLVGSLIWLAFLVPIILLVVGGIIAGTSPASFLRWSGGTTLAGGLFPLLTTAIVEEIVAATINIDPLSWHNWSEIPFWTTESGRIVTQRIMLIVDQIIGHLFDPVITIAGTVAVIGLVMVGLSFVVRDEKS